MQSNNLLNLQEELGLTVDALLGATRPLNPKIPSVSNYNELILSIVKESVKKTETDTKANVETLKEFIGIVIFLDQCPAALRLVSMNRILAGLYVRILVLIYDDEHFPASVENAVIEHGDANLIHTLCSYGHRWSKLALAKIKAKIVLWKAHARASSGKLSYYQCLRGMADAGGSVCKGIVEAMMPWSVPTLLVERGLAAWYGDRFCLTPKGWVVAMNV